MIKSKKNNQGGTVPPQAEKKKVRNHIAPLDFLPLLRFRPGGIGKELVV